MSALPRSEQIAVAVVIVLTALAGVAHYAGFASLLAFALAALALAGLAHVVSFSTEQVGRRFGPGVTGVLQSTLGNLPELFVVIFALRAGEVVVAQTSILGSLFANGLLVLGVVIVVGARQADGPCMQFRPRLPQDTATLLLVTVFIIVVVGISLNSHDPASRHVEAVSTVAAVALLGVYLAWVVPYLRMDAEARRAEPAPAQPQDGPLVPVAVSATLLALGGAGRRVRLGLVRRGASPHDRPAQHLGRLRGHRHRRDRRQRGRERGGHRARAQGAGGPRDQRREELRGADRRVPVPGAGARLAAVQPPG